MCLLIGTCVQRMLIHRITHIHMYISCARIIHSQTHAHSPMHTYRSLVAYFKIFFRRQSLPGALWLWDSRARWV